MARPVIAVENVGKKYSIQHRGVGPQDGLRHVLSNAISAPFRAIKSVASGRRDLHQTSDAADSYEEFWALKDVSFEVEQGEVVGIIGRNGAGKSTLLKLLSRITEPTTGRIRVKGRVASLLEVGTGFHPELTGRENIFLNGAILGMSRAEIKRKFDEIVAFAEVEKFLDTPVKRYSSGMYVRLAFAVAAHLEPEILIVDEVLAVGDSGFQKKCLGKMGDISRAGRTVLFVSHNMATIGLLCDRAILLEKGGKRCEGQVRDIIGEYVKSGSSNVGNVSFTERKLLSKDNRFQLLEARIVSDNSVTPNVDIDKSCELQFDFEFRGEKARVSSSVHLFDKQGVRIFCAGTSPESVNKGRHRHIYHIPENLLNDGTHSVSIIILTDISQVEIWVDDAIGFEVVETGYGREFYSGPIGGCIRPNLVTETMTVCDRL